MPTKSATPAAITRFADDLGAAVDRLLTNVVGPPAARVPALDTAAAALDAARTAVADARAQAIDEEARSSSSRAAAVTLDLSLAAVSKAQARCRGGN